MGGTSGRTFTFDFGGPLPAVWSAMADTARYNAAAALPKQTVTEIPGPDGAIKFIARAKVGGMELEWEDLPCNWVREHWFEHRRRFTRGPLALLDARLDLTPTQPGCRGDYRLEAAPSGLLGRAILAGGFLRSAERMFLGLAQQADRFARGERAVPFVPPTVPVTGAARARLETLAQQLDAGPYGHGLAERLVGAGRRGAGGRRRADPAAAARPALGRARAARDRGLPGGHAPGHAGAALGPALPALPRRQGDGGHARPDPDRRPLRHLQHRLCPQLLAQRRAGAAPVALDPADRERRVLPAGADEHAAHLGARHGRGRRGARHRGEAGAGPLPAAHAGVRPGSRHRV